MRFFLTSVVLFIVLTSIGGLVAGQSDTLTPFRCNAQYEGAGVAGGEVRCEFDKLVDSVLVHVVCFTGPAQVRFTERVTGFIRHNKTDPSTVEFQPEAKTVKVIGSIKVQLTPAEQVECMAEKK